MATRPRYYPSWLPPTPREREALIRLRRHQIGVVIFLGLLAPLGWLAVWITDSDTFLVPLTLAWLLLGVMLTQRIGAVICPRCGERFCRKPDLPFWFCLLLRRCDHCGLTLETPADPR
jgi:hypothetical protein